jgi:Holliday junction resolvase
LKEGKLERALKRKVEKLGGKALKFVSPGMVGVPDRIILMPKGKILFVEMKAPGEALSPIQDKRKRDLEALGFEVYKIDSNEQIEAFIQRLGDTD